MKHSLVNSQLSKIESDMDPNGRNMKLLYSTYSPAIITYICCKGRQLVPDSSLKWRDIFKKS